MDNIVRTHIINCTTKEERLEETVLSPAELDAMQAAAAAYEASPEYKAHRIAELKAQLAATDYKCLKYMEGWLTDAEYAPIRAERQALRDEINALEAEL